ncbi:hypothetical protein LAZ67_14002077 [Cordylochernes scorpioides]|uniref:RNA-directed DNA polymerase n=1 Tax=Cordylochernes scorpioides TaxID=51811 RepID=A0ABY6L8L6_9ARAC|nr:hypothetical protein LAZ67_14002077 [Cordylochernes scorpioides]
MEMSTPANSTNLAILGLHPSAYKVRRTPVIKAKWDVDGARGSERMWGQQTHGSWSMKKTRSNTTMIEQTHNQVPQEPTTDSTVAASLRTLTLCLDQLLNRESEEAITYDGDEPAAHFFSQLESQPNFQNLEPARQARKALSSLRGEPRKIAQDLALINKTYEEVKESLCAVYPRRPSFTLQEFYELKCTSMAEIETFYKNKVRIGLAINLPKSAIVQALSNGVPRNYGNLLKMAQPSGPEEWLCLAQQLTYEGDNTSTKAAQQRSPRQSRAPSTTVDKTPPYPCRYCGGQHWHAQCQQRGPYQRTFRTFTPAVHSVEQTPKIDWACRCLRDRSNDELGRNQVISLRPYRTPYAYQKEIQDQISQLLKHDIITRSSSPYSSPVTLVRKRDNTMRLCIDFRRVNELVPSDLHPLPLIETSMKKTRSNTTMIEQTHNQVPQEPTTDSTVAASLRTLTLCLDQLLNRESEEAITYDGDEPAAHFFSQLESQPNFQNLEPARQARKALSSLRGEPRKIAQDLALINKTYEEVKESLCAVYPRRPSFTLQEFYELKCTSMAEIETFYKNKVRIGLAINLPKSAIVQALSNGVPRNYGNLLKMAQPSGPEEWLCLAQQLTYEGDNTSTKAAQQRSPRQSRAPSTTVDKTPPYPCRYCGGQHWHAQCQQRGPYQRTFRTFTPAVHSVEQTPKIDWACRCLRDRSNDELGRNQVISLRPYRTPYAYQKEIQDQISQLLKHDIITPSSSPYSSPVTLVRKRDNTMRLCIDFRRVNELVPSDLHPLPLIETVLDNLSKARVFSTVDISNAYYQIPIAEESLPLLSFVTQQGQYNFKRLPFGFKSAPQIFEQQHLTHLRLFFKFCLEENLQLNLKKCNFYQNEIDFLGYHITAGTYSPNIKNTEIINAIRTPINIKTLQSFLGAVNVYHKFIPEYARLRHPLNQLLKENAKWLWSPNCQQAFDKLKQHLATQPVLNLFQEGLPCQVYCDASTQGIAGVLKQVHPDGNIYPVQYYSRALRSYERNYTISELECLAIVECVDKFRVYLLGTKFVIYSDHNALQWLKTIKDPTGRLFRWSLRLSAYDYEVKYLKGSRQYEADLLSRNPFCGFLSTGQIKDHQGELRRDTRYILNDKDLMTITRRGVTKIIVPPSLRGTLLQRAHRDFNHPGISQMTRLIAAQYYWDGMTNDIRTHVRTCSVCQLVKPPKGPIYGELGPLPPAVQPYELVSLDTISGFAKYGNSQTFLHVVVDHATRFPLQLSEHVQNYPKIDDARELAYQRTHERHLRDKARFDQTHRDSDFEVGDLVLAKTYHHPDTVKLAPFFSGPYKILEIISPQIVRINRSNRPLSRETDTIHVNKLKHYTENEQFISPPVNDRDQPKNTFNFPYKHFNHTLIHTKTAINSRKQHDYTYNQDDQRYLNRLSPDTFTNY